MTSKTLGSDFKTNELTDDTEATAARDLYAAAYSAHYETKDLHQALRLYRDVIAMHPGASESEYSRSQIENIVKTVVPKDVLHDAQVALALAHFEDQVYLDASRALPVEASS